MYLKSISTRKLFDKALYSSVSCGWVVFGSPGADGGFGYLATESNQSPKGHNYIYWNGEYVLRMFVDKGKVKLSSQ